MKKKSIVEKTKRWVCNNISTFYGPRFITYQPMVEKVPQILFVKPFLKDLAREAKP
jgi:hypothetical protein